MTYYQISDYGQAVNFLQDKKKHLKLFQTWVPKTRFIELLHNENGISISREDDGVFSFALGLKAPLRDDWERISFERNSHWLSNRNFSEQTDWEAHYLHQEGLPTLPISERRSDKEIGEFIKANAPDLSVFPGNKEIVHWSSLFSSENGLLGVAAICKWESGHHVIASVATDRNLRGQGLGGKLMEVIKSDISNLGIREVCLGVLSDNEPAKKLYARTGFEKLFDLRFVKNFRS
jgi:ribosomal protein S18 acetylase RimI-like enzyme